MDRAPICNVSPAPSVDSVLFIYINCLGKARDINGYIAMLLDLPSLVALEGLLDGFIRRATGLSG